MANDKQHLFNRFASAGLVKTGLFAARPADQTGMAMARAGTSEAALRIGHLSAKPVDAGERVIGIRVEFTFSH